MDARNGSAVSRGSAHLTTELYRSCMNLAEEARSLLVENEGLKRLGLNAEVLAAHAGAGGGGLEVIVAEIGRISREIGTLVRDLGESAQDLSGRSIRMLHLAHLHASYQRGWEAGIEAGFADAYRGCLSRVGRERSTSLEEQRRHLRAIGSQIDDLARIAFSIPPVTTMIRIVTAEIRLHVEELLGTADGLKAFHGHLEERVERMDRVRRAGEHVIRELEETA